MNFISRWIKNNVFYEMNGNGFNYVSAVKPVECKVSLSPKLNIFLNKKHPHSGCPCIIYMSKLHLNISSFNSIGRLKGRENVRVAHKLSFAFSCRCTAIINHTKDSNRLNLISCYIFIKSLLLMLNSEGSLQSLLDVSKHCGLKCFCLTGGIKALKFISGQLQ